MKSFDEFEGRVDALLAEEVGAEGMTMFIHAKSGGVFNSHYDDASLWTDGEARRLATYIVRQTRRDEEFIANAFSKFKGTGR